MITLSKFEFCILFDKIKGRYEIPEELGAEGEVLSHLCKSGLFPDNNFR